MDCAICLDNYVKSITCNRCKKEVCADCFIRLLTDDNDFTCPFCRWYDGIIAYENILERLSVFIDDDIDPEIIDGGYHIISSYIMCGDFKTELINYYMECIKKIFLKKENFTVGQFIQKVENKLYNFDKYQTMRYFKKHIKKFNDTLKLLNIASFKKAHEKKYKKALYMIKIKGHINSCKLQNYKNNFLLFRCDNDINKIYCRNCIHNNPCCFDFFNVKENKEKLNKKIDIFMRHIPRAKKATIHFIDIDEII